MHSLIKLDTLTGYHLQALDGEIGKVKEVFFDDHSWSVRYVVVRTGHWLLGREVLILPGQIRKIDDAHRLLQVDLTRAEVENSPPIVEQLPVSREYEQRYFTYYGWEPYWSGDPVLEPLPHISPPLEDRDRGEVAHPHLRSSDEIRGYQIQAKDGEVGHVKDFILDRQTWAIRYLVVETGNWMSGTRVLLSPSWLLEVEWAKQVVGARLSCEQIETAPEYDPYKYFSADYARELAKHYGLQNEP